MVALKQDMLYMSHFVNDVYLVGQGEFVQVYASDERCIRCFQVHNLSAWIMHRDHFLICSSFCGDACHSFFLCPRMHDGGEIDVRASYTAISVSFLWPFTIFSAIT